MVRDWDTVSDGALSEASIRSRLSHPERYRVSTYRYPPGTSLSGAWGFTGWLPAATRHLAVHRADQLSECPTS